MDKAALDQKKIEMGERAKVFAGLVIVSSVGVREGISRVGYSPNSESKVAINNRLAVDHWMSAIGLEHSRHISE